VDDALLDRAARKQSQSHIESRERQLAIIGVPCCIVEGLLGYIYAYGIIEII